MSDSIGRITVPDLVDSGLTFPLISDFGCGVSQDRPTIIHQFGSIDAKIEQRFAVGMGPRKFRFQRAGMNLRDRRILAAFWEQLPSGSVGHKGTQGPWASFTYNAPNAEGTTAAVKVTFENVPLSLHYLQQVCQVGVTFVEVPDPAAAPTYTVANTCLRFPSSTLKIALLAQTQEMIPLVHIRVREAAVDDIYLSDRRCTVGGHLYLPRVLGLGESGSEVIIQQDIAGSADNVQFTFGNADRVMTQLANDTDLKKATIDLCLYHVNTGILLQLWRGFIVTFAADGSPQFVVRASDGIFQVTQQYPVSVVSRTCRKQFDDGATCPYSTQGSGGDPDSCDYYFDSPNGCQAHSMAPYFGGHPAQPQGVSIKDNSSGTWGLGRNNVTATSIVSDSIWGNALQEIWCNDDGDPGKAFMVKAMIVAGRDESDFFDALGIVGAGPIGAYTGMQVHQNADGYRYVIAPTLDGQTPQGFKVDGGLNVVTNQPTLGLRTVAGNDPVYPDSDSFSLGQGTPQRWGPQMAAGTAFVEIRRTDVKGIQASTADLHDMQVPISAGLSGWVWDAEGNRTPVTGLTNPFWIAINALLRALGLSGSVPTVLDSVSSITVTLPPSSFYNFEGSTIGVFKVMLVVGYVFAPITPVAFLAAAVGCMVALIGGAFTGNAFSVPMSTAANLAEVILRENLSNWQHLAVVDRTTANRTIFVANFQTIWDAYVGACTAILNGDPDGSDAKKALNRSIGDRNHGGKFDWFALYHDPIANSATPGDAMTTPDSVPAQLDMFVLPALVKGDGTGAAEIADLTIDAIIGGGTEKQFRFQGVLAQQKPFRDWLVEILACGLGYFTWEFGRLKLGTRINASAVESFTIGNFLLQSLRLEPTEAAFERLVLDFADQAYQYQANTAEYTDKGHAAYYGRGGAPLTARQHLVGCGTLSQALRLAAVRTREEIGGIHPAEWRNARVVSWKTTVLALNTEVGQVVSVTHPDVPGMKGTCTVASGVCSSLTGDPLDAFIINKDVLIDGVQCKITARTIAGGVVTDFTVCLAENDSATPANATGATFRFITGDFRIQSWRLNKDWSIDISARTVTASMYDLTVGPKPLDVVPAPLPVPLYPAPARPAWAPYQIQAPSDDALFPGEWTFDLSQVYTPSADGNSQGSVTVVGKLPVNAFIPGVAPPDITSGSISQATTGGHLAGGATLRVAVCGTNASGGMTPPSKIVLVQILLGTDTNTFTITDIGWPPGSGLTGYKVFISTQDDLICFTQSGSLSASGDGFMPTSITCGGPLPRSTFALPNAKVAGVRVKGKLLVHGGVLGARVDAVSGSTIVASETADFTSADDWAGRILTIIGRYNGAAPYASFRIDAFDPATGHFTLASSASAAGVEAGDAFVVCFKGYDNSSDPTTLTDAGLLCAESGHAGLTAHAEKGLVIRVIAGMNRGAMAKVVDNTSTAYTLDRPLEIDPSSVWIVEDPAWAYFVRSADADNANYELATSLTLGATNYLDFSMLVGGFTENAAGLESSDASAPVRMVYIYGTGYVQAFISATTYDMKANDHVMTFTGVNQTVNLQPSAAIRRFPRYIIHGGTGPLLVNPAPGDTIEGLASATLSPGDRMVLMPSS